MHHDHAPPAMPATGERHSSARLPERWRPLARALWIASVAVTLGIFFASLPVYVVQLRTPCAGTACGFEQLTPEQVRVLAGSGLSLGAYAAYSVAIACANVVVCLAVSTVIALRRPEDRMALIVALMLLTLGPLLVSEMVSTSSSLWRVPNHYLSDVCVALLLLVFALFPTGRFVPRWMLWPSVAMGITAVFPWVPLLIAVGAHFAVFPAALSTLKIHAVDLGFVVFLVEAAILVVVQVYRYQQVSSPLHKQQIKWVVFGFAALIASWVLTLVPYLIFAVLAVPGSLYLPAFTAFQGVTLLLIPFAFGVAMLRYRLWDIDALINRALVYGSLTGVLGVLYLGGVVALQGLVRSLTGQTQPLVVVASTLAIAALVGPLRRVLQRGIDRRFYRRNYDAARTLAAFSATLRDEVDLNQLHVDLLAVVQETMQPRHLSLWLPARDRRAPS